MLTKHKGTFGAELQILCETRLGCTYVNVCNYVCVCVRVRTQVLIYYNT